MQADGSRTIPVSSQAMEPEIALAEREFARPPQCIPTTQKKRSWSGAVRVSTASAAGVRSARIAARPRGSGRAGARLSSMRQVLARRRSTVTPLQLSSHAGVSPIGGVLPPLGCRRGGI